MDPLELYDIAERYMEVINPSTPEKIITIARFAGLQPGQRVIDFGCGMGEALALWAETFGISGIGVEFREYACQRARDKMAARGLNERIKIVCGDAKQYAFEAGIYDLAVCMGASFIWGGYQPTIQAIRQAIKPDGKLIIGEPYWLKATAPPEYLREQFEAHPTHTEGQILDITRQEGFDIEYMVRSSHDDWDRYEAGNWHGLLRWIEENPDHPDRQQVIDWLHGTQSEYLRYGREYFGWAMYLLNPVKYG